ASPTCPAAGQPRALKTREEPPAPGPAPPPGGPHGSRRPSLPLFVGANSPGDGGADGKDRCPFHLPAKGNGGSGASAAGPSKGFPWAPPPTARHLRRARPWFPPGPASGGTRRGAAIGLL